MGNEVVIREAREEDAEIISDLCEQLSRRISAEDVIERLKIFAGDPAYSFYVAEADGRVIGFVCTGIRTEILTGLQARIDGVVVESSFRGGGVGRKLMAAAEKWAKENGSETMKLNSNTIRAEAHKFYEKIGYEKAKEQYQFKKSL